MVPALRLDAALRPLVTKYFGKTQKVTRGECRVNIRGITGRIFNLTGRAAIASDLIFKSEDSEVKAPIFVRVFPNSILIEISDRRSLLKEPRLPTWTFLLPYFRGRCILPSQISNLDDFAIWG